MVMRQDASTGQMVETEDETSSHPKSNRPLMHVKIYSPFVTYYDATAESISGENVTGPFDILPHHHNFITLLKAGELVIRGKNVGGLLEHQLRIRISGGLMHVKADRVVVFLDV